ncbi:hypothetical protein PPL_11634 [Heterostelium album PN500]|uniref:GPN-loop GTPase 3 n=1 Tax=Heterostelium pallidum (strain ATCC 26659 / Pp 5 / PN500) TaxID=670386 RepID=D3BVA8_HETP5|nr:hypothetical protein PPL_11634 [Heterostelium album PN500]EFA74665.1 hypothetical protein PPL_11634 [Heterostelium album PN500]|eukprot:XP_020426799.1 hypothetical protein PPL_11634 [Heterostelium album PN500]
MDWLMDELDDFEEDYLIIDCPGQIELVCAVFMVDSQFILDSCKFISGSLMCLSAMIRLEIPHINIFQSVLSIISNCLIPSDHQQ